MVESERIQIPNPSDKITQMLGEDINNLLFQQNETFGNNEKLCKALRAIAVLCLNYYTTINKPRNIGGHAHVDWFKIVSFDVPSVFLVTTGLVSQATSEMIGRRHLRKTGSKPKGTKDVVREDENSPFNRIKIQIEPDSEENKWKIAIVETYIEEKEGNLSYESGETCCFRREDLYEEKLSFRVNRKGGKVTDLDNSDLEKIKVERKLLESEIKIGSSEPIVYRRQIDPHLEIEKALSLNSINTTLAFLYAANMSILS